MANEKRLIFANVLIDELKWLQENVSSASAIEIQEYIDRVNRQPTVDAVEVVHGRWKHIHISGFGYIPACSECGWHDSETNYCPNCGAKMDGDGDGT